MPSDTPYAAELKRWRLLAYVQAAAGFEAFSMATLVVFFVEYASFSFEAFSTFTASLFILLCLFEIPAGAMADRFGRKLCLVLGNAIYACGMAALLTSRNTAALPWIAVLYSGGSALASGAFQSMMFDRFSALGATAQFHVAMAKATGIGLWASAIAAFLGGAMAAVSLALPLTVDALLLTLLTLVLWWKVPSAQGGEKYEHLTAGTPTPQDHVAPSSHSFRELLGLALQFCASSRVWCFLVLTSALTFAGIRASFNLYQPLLRDAAVAVEWFGVIFGCLVLCAGICSQLFSRIKKSWLDRGHIELAIIALFVVSLSLFVLNRFPPLWLIGCIAAHQIVRGLYPSYYSYRLNQAIPAAHPARTTLLSMAQWARALVSAIAIFCIGLLTENSDMATSFIVLNVVIAIGLLAAYALHYSARYGHHSTTSDA
ncbi:MFS transporter [Pandoraea bronchicola]|uniref:MFS transporter n=1 Tax=Pandoraea bronchicola TaxID=2508287 RepID=A0A5E5BNI3_9BURK|nr:MFS transporter [Pandoraea bronchicola]VVE86918.1 hypothetical protein PBR20603_00842 [Pandoraea bronchicola]